MYVVMNVCTSHGFFISAISSFNVEGTHNCKRPMGEGKCAFPRRDNIHLAEMKNQCDYLNIAYIATT